MERVAGKYRALVVVTAWWALFGVAHGVLRVAVMPAIAGGTARTVLMAALIDLYWVAPTLVVLWLVRQHGAGRLTTGRSVLIHLLHCAAAVAIWPLWSIAALWSVRGRTLPYADQLTTTFGTALVTYLSILGVTLAIESYKRLLEHRRHALAANAELSRARLASLTLQLQPHFLFNTLHLVAELVHEDAVGAGEVLRGLRNLLASAFDSAAAREISLREELALLAPYIAIQRRRFGDRLRVVQQISPEAARATVPVLLLQPLVENAIRHSVGQLPGTRVIGITADVVDGRLRLCVWDDGEGPTARTQPSGSRGLGLKNTSQRLDAVFRGAHELRLQARPAGGTEVLLTLPMRTAQAGERPAPAALASADIAGSALDRSGLLAGTSRWSVAFSAAALVALLQFQLELTWTSAFSSDANPAANGATLLAFTLAALTMTPILAALFEVAGKLPERPAGWVVLAPIAALAVAVVHIGVLSLLARLVGIGAISPGPSPIIGLGLLDFLAFLAIAGLWSALRFAHASRREGVEGARRHNQLATIALNDLRWHAQPPLLLHVLDQLAALAERDPAAVDERVGEFGELLRLLLDRQADQWVRVSDDAALGEALLRVLAVPASTMHAVRLEISDTARDCEIPAFTIPATLLVAMGFPADAGEGVDSVAIRGDCDDETVSISVVVGRSSRPAAARDSEREVVELRARLESQCGAGASVILDSTEHGVEAALRIPLHMRTSTAESATAS